MNISWIMEVINTLAQMGRTEDGGSNRMGFTDADMQARDYVLSLITDMGLTYTFDNFGNIFARLEGSNPAAPAVATGSHIDTVPNGGHYDGVLGSVLSLAALKKIQEEGYAHSHPLELIIFQLEESSRFSHATMGSKVIAGKDLMATWAKAQDKDGISLKQALASRGFDFDKIPESARKGEEFKAFIELHIDQSKDLERAEKPVGIVEAIAAPIRSKVTVQGRADHSGSTQMEHRKDALVAASELVLAINRIACEYSSKKIVATVGNVKVYPGAMNVVPGMAELFVDLRGIDKEIMDEVFNLFQAEAQKIDTKYDTTMSFELLSAEKPVSMDAEIRDTLATVCKDLNIAYEEVISGAGHDAMNMAPLTPTGMIFVRGKGGISHNPAEFASEQDIEQGFEVLYETLKRLAK